jgi:hypothetical protein
MFKKKIKQKKKQTAFFLIFIYLIIMNSEILYLFNFEIIINLFEMKPNFFLKTIPI